MTVPAAVRIGEIVPIRLRAVNRTAHSLDLYLRGREDTFDVVVSDAGGDPVWRRLEGEIIPAIVHLRALGPGESLELVSSWDQRASRGGPLPPGRYLVRGLLLLEDASLGSPAVTVTISP